MIRAIILISTFLCNTFLGYSQINPTEHQSTSENAFRQAMDLVFLFKNKDNILPIKQLETRQIVSLSIGLSVDKTFEETLQKYTAISTVQVQSDDDLLHISTAVSPNADLFIIGLSAQIKLNNELQSYLQFISTKADVIVVFFGKKEGEHWIETQLQNQIDAVLWTPLNSSEVESIAAQTLFGGLPIKSRWSGDDKVSASKYTLPKKIRLGYVPPSIVGVSATKLESQIDKIVYEGIHQKAYPGAQVLVAKKGQIIFDKSYGHHTYDQTQKVRATDLYDLASVTKITSVLPAVMRLYGEGQFDLNATLGQDMPMFKKSNKGHLLWRRILAHHAQLEPWIPYWEATLNDKGDFKARTFKTTPSRQYSVRVADNLYLHRNYKRRIYRTIKQSSLLEKKEYKYSGLSFYLLPKIIEMKTKTDFDTYLKTTFFRPLGAFDVTYNPYLQYDLERIVPTERDTFFRKTLLHGYVHDEGAAMMGGISGNAGLFSTANDLAKIAQLYLNKGSYGGEQLIAAKALEEFTRCQYCAEDNRRGLGFDKPLISYKKGAAHTARDASPQSYGHSGYTGTFVWIDPKEELIFIFLSNRVYPTRENGKLYQLDIRPRIHQAIYDSF